jgi:hypothetical protein
MIGGQTVFISNVSGGPFDKGGKRLPRGGSSGPPRGNNSEHLGNKNPRPSLQD